MALFQVFARTQTSTAAIKMGHDDFMAKRNSRGLLEDFDVSQNF